MSAASDGHHNGADSEAPKETMTSPNIGDAMTSSTSLVSFGNDSNASASSMDATVTSRDAETQPSSHVICIAKSEDESKLTDHLLPNGQSTSPEHAPAGGGDAESSDQHMELQPLNGTTSVDGDNDDCAEEETVFAGPSNDVISAQHHHVFVDSESETDDDDDDHNVNDDDNDDDAPSCTDTDDSQPNDDDDDDDIIEKADDIEQQNISANERDVSDAQQRSANTDDVTYDGFVPVVFRYLTQETTPRKQCLRLITWPYPFYSLPCLLM